MKRPLAAIAVLLCAGTLYGYCLRVPFVHTYGIACVLVCVLLLCRRRRLFFYDAVVCGAIFFCSGAMARNQQIPPACHISHYVRAYPDGHCVVRGYVASEPRVVAGQTSFILSIRGLQRGALWYHCCGDLLVRAKTSRTFEYADTLLVQCDVAPLYATAFMRHGVLSPKPVFAHRAKAVRIKKLLPGYVNPFKKFSLRCKAELKTIIHRYVPPSAAHIMDALVLGERKSVPAMVNRSMVKTGTVHILVVSGLHVVVVSQVIAGVLQCMRVPRRIRPFLVLPALVFYCVLAGCTTSVVRATIMAAVFLCADLFRRDADVYNALSAAVIFIVGINPRQIFDIGFQLSFASVFSIAYFYPRSASFFHIHSVKARSLRYVLGAFLVSISAWLGTMVCIAYYFRIVTPITVIANLFIVPLASFATMAGFLVLGFGAWCPLLCRGFGLASGLLINLMLAVNSIFIKIPLAYIYLQ